MAGLDLAGGMGLGHLGADAFHLAGARRAKDHPPQIQRIGASGVVLGASGNNIGHNLTLGCAKVAGQTGTGLTGAGIRLGGGQVIIKVEKQVLGLRG